MMRDEDTMLQLLIDIRTELRLLSQYALADWIRQRLLGHGIALEDTAAGTTLRYIRG